ncbi:poly(A)-specific ribonuclease PARN-like isoform X2 [Brachypodium distachyon]|uniref:poly(A)-specific ribonuclease PARN-like isoform X2 n=1 Tax=Brachypodium distachyon TaxID=15368 RepID=UPI000D0D6C90|nr:poly(A)-specific ribonuclease PARN-like isoform X2 [Brachypodium distachyon]|eukprot:XP_024317809.1 poly(A)-specific ribonuclease PARN-like isoform X2 [Brachypodium distachyon]
MLALFLCSSVLKFSIPSSLLMLLRVFWLYRYNFHLFPRDELQLGMPSYSFSCQTSYFSSMARDGFDFNMCIYDGISYLSRVQESLARQKIFIPHLRQPSPSPSTTVADSVFTTRIKSRIQHWRKGYAEPSKTADGSLVNSLRKLILGGESYGSRPSMSIDVCSDRQVQLVLETINRVSDDLVPLVVPDKAGMSRAVRVIFTSSEEDKNLLLMDIQKLEDEHSVKFRGFREVIDLLSSSQKPIISYNCLNDLTMIHTKFIGPLPPNMHEFTCSLRMVFSSVVDVGHLWREIGPLRNAKNIQAALSYLQRQYFVPMEIEIPQQDGTNSVTKGGENVLRITKLFAKLSMLLKISPKHQSQSGEQHHTVEDFCNIFYPGCMAGESDDVDCTKEPDITRTVSTDSVIFLWGFRKTSAKELRYLLTRLHHVFSNDFELRLLDKTCSVLIFRSSDTPMELLREISSESPSLNNFFSEGLKAAGFDVYWKVCRLGLWDSDLAEALEAVSSEQATSALSGHGTSEIYWNSSLMLDIKEYLEC